MDKRWTLKHALAEVEDELEKAADGVQTPAVANVINAVEMLRQVCARLAKIADAEDSLL
ncbi:MAG: hypothetical protein KGL39_20570 [Patescibacteria group bacterium]|nr:hypothetical protein [Patescibacteria group bacterium]